MQAQRARGASVLIVSHRPGILAVADRVVVMQAGRIRLQGPRDEVLAQLQPRAATGLSAAAPMPSPIEPRP